MVVDAAVLAVLAVLLVLVCVLVLLHVFVIVVAGGVLQAQSEAWWFAELIEVVMLMAVWYGSAWWRRRRL